MKLSQSGMEGTESTMFGKEAKTLDKKRGRENRQVNNTGGGNEKKMLRKKGVGRE